MVGRVVLVVNLSHVEEDATSLMSDIPMHLPASANVSLCNSALVTFSQAEGGLMRNVPSLHPLPSQTGMNPWQLQHPRTYLGNSRAAHVRQQNCSTGYTTSLVAPMFGGVLSHR